MMPSTAVYVSALLCLLLQPRPLSFRVIHDVQSSPTVFWTEAAEAAAAASALSRRRWSSSVLSSDSPIGRVKRSEKTASAASKQLFLLCVSTKICSLTFVKSKKRLKLDVDSSLDACVTKLIVELDDMS